MSDNEEEEHRLYREDPRIPCRYGIKCYQKNEAHHEKYKHPSSKHTKKQNGTRSRVPNKKRKAKDGKGTVNDGPKKKIQKKHDNVVDEDSHGTVSDTENAKNDENQEAIKKRTSENIVTTDKEDEVIKGLNTDDLDDVKDRTNWRTIASLLEDCDVNVKDVTMSRDVAQKIISNLFLTEMPDDFFQFYEFCKSIDEKDCWNALKDIHLRLVGPYDVFKENFLNFKADSKEALLRHWRYYYDPPEFQTIIKADDNSGLHFGYWRDDITQKPVFVAKNKASANCLIEAMAENLFGAVDSYIGEQLKLATPFEKPRIGQLHQKLKHFAKEKEITLEKKTTNIQAREKKVVARTFHKIGIVVPYDKKTELGYRDLAVTDNELHKLLKQIDQAPTAESRKAPLSKLEEVIRLATIAADECDFGTCLELGHDLFSSGVSSVQNKALNMLSLAYTLLQRPQLLEIAQAHLKNRRNSLNLSVLAD